MHLEKRQTKFQDKNGIFYPGVVIEYEIENGDLDIKMLSRTQEKLERYKVCTFTGNGPRWVYTLLSHLGHQPNLGKDIVMWDGRDRFPLVIAAREPSYGDSAVHLLQWVARRRLNSGESI